MGTPTSPYPADEAAPGAAGTAPAAPRLNRRRLVGGVASGPIAAVAAADWLSAREPATPWDIASGPENVRASYAFAGVGCRLCVAVVQDTAAPIAAGASPAQTRAEIDAFSAPYAGYATDTAHPPHDGG